MGFQSRLADYRRYCGAQPCKRSDNVCILFLLVSCFCIVLATEPALADGPVNEEQTEKEEFDWRSAMRCGPNSLFVLMRMNGLTPDYDSIVESMPMSEKGVSVQDLVETSSNHGFPLVAIRGRANDLDNLPLPAIVHITDPHQGLGHFTLLLDYNEPLNSFSLFECTHGELEELKKGDFFDRWSGIALVDKSRVRNPSWDLYLVLFSTAAAGLALYTVVSHCYTSRRGVE